MRVITDDEKEEGSLQNRTPPLIESEGHVNPSTFKIVDRLKTKLKMGSQSKEESRCIEIQKSDPDKVFQTSKATI